MHVTCVYMHTHMQPEAGSAISYPSMDDPLPPSYESASAEQPAMAAGGTGQLIDLGTDITVPPPDPQGGSTADDIVAQLAQLGVTTTPSSGTNGASAPSIPQQTSTGGATTDEFDMFAESRTAYGTQQQGGGGGGIPLVGEQLTNRQGGNGVGTAYSTQEELESEMAYK